MMDNSWKVMVGVLHGFGECVWEENLSGTLRKISKLYVTPHAQVGMSKAIIGGVFAGLEEIPGEGLVVFSRSTTQDQQQNFKAFWSNIAIPQNGGPRLKLT